MWGRGERDEENSLRQQTISFSLALRYTRGRGAPGFCAIAVEGVHWACNSLDLNPLRLFARASFTVSCRMTVTSKFTRVAF